MRWKITLFIGVPLLAIVACGLLLALSPALPFRANHVRYLMNARRYNQALVEYEWLKAAHPRDAQRLSAAGDFSTRLVEDASSYYSQPFRRKLEGSVYLALLDAVAARRDLAPLAHRKRLDFLARLDGKSSGTLHAARQILNGQGFDFDAVWWAVYNQYDPARPLEIPGELIKFRQPVQDALAAGPARPTREQSARATLIKALLALADRNWAEAAESLDRYRIIHPEMETLDLAQGLATLKAGQPEAAIHHLRQFHQRHAADQGALRWLAEAYLTLPEYAWASHALDEIRAVAPAQESLVFQDCFGTTGNQPLVQLCAELRPGAPRAGGCGVMGLAQRGRAHRRRAPRRGRRRGSSDRRKALPGPGSSLVIAILFETRPPGCRQAADRFNAKSGWRRHPAHSVHGAPAPMGGRKSVNRAAKRPKPSDT